jgi:hypothetical protein
MFYMPRFYWKRFEGERIMRCTVDCVEPVLKEEERMKKAHTLLENYKKFKGKHNQKYAMKFFAFELFNLFNAVVQFWFTDKLMGGRFKDYGLKLFSYYQHQGEEEFSQVRGAVQLAKFSSVGGVQSAGFS